MKQRHIAALLAEVIGTFVLVLVVLNVSRYGLPFFTAIGAGVAVAAFYSIFATVSGGNFNPAITLGLFSIRKLTFVRTIGYLVAQAVGALLAWQFYEYITGRTLKNSTAAFDWKILIAEAIGALVIGMAYAAVYVQKLAKWQAAATLGCGLFLAITVAGLASNGLLNPALALGVRSFDINYFLGAVAGAIVGMLVFAYVITPLERKPAKSAAAKVSAPAKKAPAKKKSPAKKAKK
jgi:glycerol uptake facilitator-like aquaporin